MYIASLIVLLGFVGCASHIKDIRIVQSKAEIVTKHIEIEDGDTLLCDPDGCRKLK